MVYLRKGAYALGLRSAFGGAPAEVSHNKRNLCQSRLRATLCDSRCGLALWYHDKTKYNKKTAHFVKEQSCDSEEKIVSGLDSTNFSRQQSARTSPHLPGGGMHRGTRMNKTHRQRFSPTLHTTLNTRIHLKRQNKKRTHLVEERSKYGHWHP